jgi:hypothetical protein
MGPTSVDPLGRARTIVDECLKRDYCRANSIATAAEFTLLRHEFQRYREQFQCATGTIDTSEGSENCSPSKLTIVGCSALLASLTLSCLGMYSWYSWSH